MRRALTAALLGTTAILGAVASLYVERDDPETPQGMTVRYGNVTFTVPDDGAGTGIEVNGAPESASPGRPAVRIYLANPAAQDESDLAILDLNTETGEVLSDTLSPLMPGVVKSVLASRVVAELPREQTWPFDALAPKSAPISAGSMTYVAPDYARTGIRSGLVSASCIQGSDCVSPVLVFFVDFGPGLRVDPATGRIVKRDASPLYDAAFDAILNELSMTPALATR